VFLPVLVLVLASVLNPWSPQTSGEPDTVTLLVEEETTALSTASDSPSDWTRVEVPLGAGVEQAVDALEAETGSRVVIEHVYQLFGPEAEELFGQQWHLENNGQTGGLTDADIDAATAWKSSLGTGTVVAVLDSGVDPENPDLSSRLHPGGHDFVDGDNDPSPEGSGDTEAHGTAVAGVISAAANGEGVTGVAPAAVILPIRVCSAGSCSTLDVHDGIIYAVDQGADIINVSLGGIVSGDVLMEEAISYARSRDVLVVTAAGNGDASGNGIDLDNLPSGQQLVPGGLPLSNIMNVASSGDRDILSRFSNFGPGTVDIAAPGEEILTTDTPDPFSGGWQGTSFSAPVVSGVAALLLSKDPGISHHELIARITGFVDRPAGVAGATASGRINAGRTLTLRFLDTSSSVFVNAIAWLAGVNVTEGCNPPHNHLFCPAAKVTRGEMAVFLSRGFGLPPTGSDFFSDDNGLFYEGAANRLRAAGLTVGCGSGRYCGEEDISRGEMAAMLARALRLPASGSDPFVDDDGSVFENAINKIAAAGITVGCNPPSNNRYCPTRGVTRGEMAAFIKRAVEF
jgi:subtilisin family serine protease